MVKVKMICRYCESESVSANAQVSWNVDTQDWEADTPFEKGDHCNNCGSEGRVIKQVSIDYVPKPKYVVLCMMYRDGANYKSGEDFYFAYDSDLSEDEIRERFKPLTEDNTDGFVPSYYGLETISPVENEFIPVSNDYDHAFCTITDIRFESYCSDKGDKRSISEILTNLEDESSIELAREDAKIEAKEYLKKQLKALEDGKS